MSLIRTNRSSLFLAQQKTLPAPPASFIETTKPITVVPKFSMIDTNRMSGSMNSSDQVVDTCRTEVNFLASVALRGVSNPTDEPEYGELVKISGFEQKPNADYYELINTPKAIPKGSALVYMDGQKFSFTDTLVGSTEFDLKVGEIGLCNTTLSGFIDDAIPTAEANPTVTLNTNAPLIVGCADIVLLDGTVLPAERVVFKTNPKIAKSYSMGGKDGLRSNTITDMELTAEITFMVDSAVFGIAPAMIKAGQIKSIKVIVGADALGKPIDNKSVVFMADASKAVTYSDKVNQDLLQRTLTLRLYDGSATPALRVITGKTSSL